MERTTIGAILRAQQAFCNQVCAKETLHYGIAYYCPAFPDVPEVQQFREVLIDDPAAIPGAFQQAEQWFADHGLGCARWVPAEGRPPEDLDAFLSGQGFHKRITIAMLLTEWQAIESAPEMRIVPARAMRAAYRTTFLAGTSPSTPEARARLADVYAERLNDPQFEVSVALVDNRPAGRCALHEVGDIGRITDLHVASGFDRRSVALTLLAHILTRARRMMCRMICTELDGDELPNRQLFEKAGFVPDGEIVEFYRDEFNAGGPQP